MRVEFEGRCGLRCGQHAAEVGGHETKSAE